MPDQIRRAAAAGSPSITVTTAALSQSTLDAIADLDAAAGITVTGGAAPYTYLWTSTHGSFGDDTTLTSSWTPTGSGVHALILTVTDAGLLTTKAVVQVTVGVDGKVLLWYGNAAALAANDYTTGGTTRTIDGLTITIVNQGNLAAGSGADGSTGIDLSVAGDHTLWFAGADPRGAAGLAATIQSVFALHGLTYNRLVHNIDFIVKWAATPAPTTSAVYGALLANGAWSTTTTHVMGSLTDNYAGNANTVSSQIQGTTDANYKNGPSPGSYPRWQGWRRVGQSVAFWSSTTAVADPSDIPAAYAEGYQSINGSIDVATVWNDATDIFGVVTSNAGTGTSSNTVATMAVWASM